MKYFFLLLSSLLFSSGIYACSCASPGPMNDEQYNTYDFIASGMIDHVEEVNGERLFSLKINKFYKGNIREGLVSIYTPLSSAACGLSVKKGQEWLIYATGENELYTGLCTRSLPLKMEGMGEIPPRAREDLEYLKNKTSGTNSEKMYSIGVIDQVYSKELDENRTLNIYLPEGYKQNDSAIYPVIYLLDGSYDEDFLHVVGLLQFCNFSWLGYMPKAIVVGIANTDRKRDFTFPTTIKADKKEFPTTGGSAAFIQFIEHELQPYIQMNYRVNGTEMLIGQSLGGLLATEILYTKPHLFEHYFIVSPSLWWDGGSLLKKEPAFSQPGFDEEISVFLAVGDEGRIKKDTRTLMKSVRKNEIPYQYEYLKAENHGSILHVALYRAFKNFKP